jgi:hypothetical protein
VARANVLDEDPGEWLTDEEAGQRTERALYGLPEEIQTGLELLEEILDKAGKVTPRRDSKLGKPSSQFPNFPVSQFPNLPIYRSLRR